MPSRFFPIARFEAAYQLKSPVFLVSFVLFFLLAFGGITSDNIQLGGVGNVNVNSPDAITQNILIFSLIAMFVVIAFVANVVLRDVESRSAGMFYSTPIGKFEYLLGRFSGAFAVSILLLAAIPPGIMVGVQMPWLDPERLGPFALMHYLHPFVVYGVVNLFFAGAIAFALATLTLSILIVVIYYSAELVWREREARMHEVIDSTPVPGWVQARSKMVAMIVVLVVLMSIGVAASMLFARHRYARLGCPGRLPGCGQLHLL